MYKLLNSLDTKQYIIRLSDSAQIPMCEDNTDYQAYLKWLEEGNTPIPAENE
jgi:hypothetical protein